MAKIMGILNVTPDSFYDGGRYFDGDQALQRALKMIEEGADILDIGGESTRPGSLPISVDEELRRVLPVIGAIRKVTSLPLSIDTSKPQVAEAALEAGATMINDVTGFRHKDMRLLAAKTGVDICLMHMQGWPESMQKQPNYAEGVVNHLISYFNKQIELLMTSGVQPEKIILDPGIGFGKSVADNVHIIQNLSLIKKCGGAAAIPAVKKSNFRLLLGISRKSFIQRLLNKPSEETLCGTLVLNSFALLSGVDIMRVHDVQPHFEMVKLMKELGKC